MYVAKVIISTSDDLSLDIQRLGFGEKIVSIPNGYDADHFKPLTPSHNAAPILLTVRRLVPKTGIQYLIAALPELRRAFPQLRLLCVGPGRLHHDLQAMAVELGVADAVTFVGPVEHDALLSYEQQADIVVFPSTAESTSLACIEAMALQKVIVASRVGGLIELLGKNEERGYLVPMTDSEHCTYEAPMNIEPERIQRLAAAIIYALRNREEARKKAKKAAAFAPVNYAWSVVIRRTVDEVYKPVTGILPIHEH